MQTKIDKKLLMEHYSKWHEENTQSLHPLTTFLQSIGLRYIQLFRKDYWICDVEDQNKYMLAKIKYGI